MRVSALALGVLGVGGACARRDPPAWDAGAASHASVALAVSAAAPPPIADAGAPAALDATPLPEVPAVDAGALPQTHDEPAASGAAFDARAHALWDAIVSDDPDRGMPFFFPLAAYEQVKAIPNPASDWRRRLVAAYARDIHAMHAKLGPNAASARFVALEVPKERGRWVNPGEEYNKLGYFRVFGSKLRYDIDGKPRAFDVASLISWRGEWYVVHLGSIK